MNFHSTEGNAVPPGMQRFSLIQKALVLCLTLGFFDTIFSMLSSGSHWSWILLPTATTVLSIFITYLILWLALRPLFAILSPTIKTNVLATSVAFFIGVLFILLLMLDLIHVPHTKVDLMKQFVMLLISGLAGIGVYGMDRAMQNRPQFRSRIGTLFLLLPVVLAETIVIFCIFVKRPDLRFTVFLFSALATWAMFHFGQSRFRIRWVLLLLTAIVFVAPLVDLAVETANSSQLPQKHPHKIKRVILITVDTLRADALSIYNNKARPTPSLQMLANESIVFTNAIAPAPWTQPSFISMMTGVSPFVHQSTRHDFGIPGQLTMLAERMHEAGYYTAAIGTNPVLATFSKGFQEFQFFSKPIIRGFGGSILRQLFSEKFDWNPDAARLSEISADWIRKHSKENFFLWVHYFDPHVPYSPPSKYIYGNPPAGRTAGKYSLQDYWHVGSGDFVPSSEERNWIESLYLGEVRYVDDSIGHLLSALRAENLYDDSLIVFASDHGEEFWEHGHSGHGRSLYREVLRVPFLMKIPFSHNNRRVDKLVSTSSIAPTICDFTGIPLEPDSLSRISLAPLCIGNASDFEEKPVASTGLAFFDEEFSVTWKQWKYIKKIAGGEELYDTSKDPFESLSLVSSDVEHLNEGRRLLQETKDVAQRLRKHYGISGPHFEEIDSERRDAMRAFGYIH